MFSTVNLCVLDDTRVGGGKLIADMSVPFGCVFVVSLIPSVFLRLFQAAGVRLVCD